MMSDQHVRILYDGGCPFCQSYVTLAALRRDFDTVDLMDARQHPDWVRYYDARGYPIDGGMIVETHDGIYFGSEAVWAVNALITRNPLLRIFSAHWFLRTVYPLMRALRGTSNFVLGRKPLASW